MAKPTQRERLVEAMFELCAEKGYPAVSVAQVSSRAGVSSATFYQQFTDKEDCLLAAYRSATTRVFGRIRAPADGDDWRSAAHAVFDGLLSALQRDPSAGRLLFVEALAGGSRVRATRKRVLAQLEDASEALLNGHATGEDTLDIPVAGVVGAVRSIVSRHLRTHSEDRLPLLVDDLLAWISAYAVPAGHTRWSTGPGALLEVASTPKVLPLPTPLTRHPHRLPRGRHGLPASVVARSQHGRIIRGTADVMLAKGYPNATVTDIVAAAGIARDVFYEHFANKQHAFLEAQHYATQHIIDTCATAYFSADQWPERVWKALKELLALVAANPTLAHLRVVDAYAAGPAAIRNTEELTRSATIFLQEGFRYRPESQCLPRLCSQAITGALFELIYGHVGRGDARELPRRLPQLTYIAIAPFTGPREAVQILAELAA